MEYFRSISSVTTTVVALSACATDAQSPEYEAGGLPDDIAAQILIEYKRFLPDVWERGTITVESCSGKETELMCDYFIEHQTNSCDFGAYIIYFPAGTGLAIPTFRAFPDQRALKCLE